VVPARAPPSICPPIYEVGNRQLISLTDGGIKNRTPHLEEMG